MKDQNGQEVKIGDWIGFKDDHETCGKVIGFNRGEFKVEMHDDMTGEVTVQWVERTRAWKE